MRFIVVLIATVLFCSQCAERQETAGADAAQVTSVFKPVADVRQVMTAITIPSSTAIFDAASETPKDDSDWDRLHNNALALAESGNLLIMPGRAVDNDVWVKEAQAMTDAAMLAVKAAEAKNADAVIDAGDKIYATCESCHMKYMKQ